MSKYWEFFNGKLKIAFVTEDESNLLEDMQLSTYDFCWFGFWLIVGTVLGLTVHKYLGFLILLSCCVIKIEKEA